MPVDNQEDFVPRAPRFKVSGSSEANVTITRTEEGDQASFAADLIDVSQHGTKLRVPVNLRFEEALQIKIEVVGTELEYHGIASVRHIRSVDNEDGEERWVIGCAIAPALSDETFSFLATTAGKERRRFRRLNVAAEATVRRQAQAEGTEAALHNLSSGGFCFSSTDLYEVGERVQLAIDGTDGEPRIIDAHICWQVESPDGSIAGCKFSSRDSYAELCSCLTDQPALGSPTRPSEAPTSKLVLTAAVLAMFVPPMMTLMLQANKVAAKPAIGEQTAEQVETTETEVADALTEQANEKPSEQASIATVDQSLINALASEGNTVVIEDDAENKPAIVPESLVDSSPAASSLVEEPLVREWVDNTGKFRTQAELVKVTDEHVVLLKQDGKQSTVPWRRLSEADQQIAREWQARQE